MAGRLLIEERPLMVLPGLVMAIHRLDTEAAGEKKPRTDGAMNQAVFLQQLHYWVSEAKSGKIADGRRWVYNTYDQWQEQYPFWSVDTIKRIALALEGHGLILTRGDLNAHKVDRTKWYTINYDHPLFGGSTARPTGQVAPTSSSSCPALDEGKLPHSRPESTESSDREEAAAPPVASVDEEEAFEAGALPGGETPPPTPSPKEAGAITAEVNRYWAAYKQAAGLTALQAKQQQGKARGQLRAVLGDPEARAGITIEAFAAQATRTQQRLAARGQLQFLSPHEVFADLANATAATENVTTQRDRMDDLIRVYEAWKWNRERTKLWVGSDERRAQLRSDIESSLTAALGDTPDLTPRGFLHALEWRWYLEPVGEQRPCTPRDLRWAVQAWVRDGRPGRNPGMALYQRGNELETVVDQIERMTGQGR